MWLRMTALARSSSTSLNRWQTDMRLAPFAMLVILPLLVAAAVPEPEGFRLDNYNAPVPDMLTGARTVDAAALAAAMAEGAIAIDVLAAPRRPPSLPQDRPWLPVPRMHV